MSTSETEVAHLCETYVSCVYNKDYEGLSAIYHESLRAFDLWGNGFYDNKAEWSANLKHWLTSLNTEKVIVNFESFKAETNSNIGFAHAFVTFKAIDENNVELRKMKNRLSWGLIKVENNWLITHQHTSVPIDLETTKAIFFPFFK